MELAEQLLLALSRDPGPEDCAGAIEHWDLDNALSILTRVYPPFLTEIAGKTVLDFGCGNGWQAVAMARAGAGRVVGVDSNLRTLGNARRLADREAPGKTVEFVESFAPSLCGQFDLVVSQNSMEHFGDPVGVVELMKSAIKPDGRIFITFGPPWLSPYGSHMQFFAKVPWVNVLFSEKTVMTVRRRFRDDGAMRYEEVTSGLNKMTVRKFERIVARCGMRVVYHKLECVKGVDFLAMIPGVREFFISHITCLLARGGTKGTTGQGS